MLRTYAGHDLTQCRAAAVRLRTFLAACKSSRCSWRPVGYPHCAQQTTKCTVDARAGSVHKLEVVLLAGEMNVRHKPWLHMATDLAMLLFRDLKDYL